jgi:hypothetical protein
LLSAAPFTLREEHSLKVFKHRALRRVYGLKMKERVRRLEKTAQ